MELIVALCWSIWHSRNLFIFKNKKEDFQLSVAGAEAIVQSYKRIQMPQLQAISDQNLASHKHWKCPPAGWFKVNVDAAIKIDNQRVGLAIVIRNSEGKLITAAIKPTKWLDRVDYAEAEATRFRLEVAESVGCLPLIVETDSKEVTDLVSARKSTKAEIFWIVSEVQDTMKRLKHVKLQHSPRTCNGFTHTLAKLALDYPDCVIWEDNIPTHLLYLFTELND